MPARAGTTVSKARFDRAFAAFLRRSEARTTAKTFFQVLAEIELERANQTIELRAKVVGKTLRFEPSAELCVHENEILVGGQRIVVRVF